jgi:hypothetical protein
MVLMICIHQYAGKGKKIFSRIGISLALITASMLITDYYLQVTVIQSDLLNGESDGLALLTQLILTGYS